MTSVKEKYQAAIPKIQEKFKLKNRMAVPKLMKVTVSVGTGKQRDKKRLELVADRLAKITGQKASPRPAKQAIASFKSRQGDIIGMKVTLRGARMYGFLDKLFNIALPRIRDFRGYPVTGIDAMGNYTLGIKEHTIFPESADEDLKDVFGMAVTFTTTAKKKEHTEELLRSIGVPFKKA